MLVIKKIPWYPLALMLGAMYVVVGIVVGAIFLLVSVAQGERLAYGVLFLLISPIFYGALGFIGGAILAALYNLLAPRIGGIRLEVEQTGP
ncbi:MAG: hypothetical protein K6U75_12165 [Firmicutes bacterium]|nr:hypothetical protein [Bacillota bacterium]